MSQYDCVVVPGLGAFLAHRVGARFSADGKQVVPPCRVYTFNPALSQTDGMLVHSVSRALSIPRARAEEMVSRDVEAMIDTLHASGSLTLGRLGTIRLTASGTFDFTPAPADTLTPMAQWLAPVNVVCIDVKPEEERSEETPVAIKQHRIAAPVRRFVRTVAAAAAVVAVAIVASTPVTVNKVHYASATLPAVSAPRAAYVPSVKAPVLMIEHVAEEAVPVDTAARTAYQNRMKAEKTAPVAVVAPETVNRPEVPVATISAADKYCVIVGSLNSLDEAREFISRTRRNYSGPLDVLEKDGRYRVYAATSASYADAQRVMTGSGIARRFAGAWVCSR